MKEELNFYLDLAVAIYSQETCETDTFIPWYCASMSFAPFTLYDFLNFVCRLKFDELKAKWY